MDIQIRTFPRAIMNECVHMECIRMDTGVAQVLLDRMGAPYESGPKVSRWSGVLSVPTIPMMGMEPVQVPYEVVMCERGASVRCHWTHVNLIREIVGRMVPELTVEIIPNVIRVG